MAIHLTQSKARSCDSQLFHLQQTAAALTDLKTLYEDFNFKLSYASFTQVLIKSYISIMCISLHFL